MTTFDPGQTQSPIALSGGDLIGTVTAGPSGVSGWRTTLSTDTHSTGKYAFEITSAYNYAGVFVSQLVVGVNTAQQTGNHIAKNITGFGVGADGAWLNNNTVGGFVSGIDFSVAGDTIMILVDLDAGDFSAISSSDGGTYVGYSSNGNLSSGAFYAGLSILATAVAQGTANFGATAFVNTLPAGYMSWDGAQGGAQPVGPGAMELHLTNEQRN